MNDRTSFDLDAYIERIQNNPCFICEMVAGRLDGNHVIHQDDEYIAFLNKYPTLYGYVLVAPVSHKEQVTADFTVEE
jgi:diadenosine tetraphosphate (Ap4A) HIT family hydrolase